MNRDKPRRRVPALLVQAAALLALAATLAACMTATPAGPAATETPIGPAAGLGATPAASPTRAPETPSTAIAVASPDPTSTTEAVSPTVPARTPPATPLLPVTGPQPGDEPLAGQALVEALRGGGYVLYFRHGATSSSQTDHEEGDRWWTRCEPERMRQLSPEGQAQARAIGDAFRRMTLPVGRVLASPYCRTMETGQLMGLGPVISTTDIINIYAAGVVGGEETVVASARRQLATPPVPGTNTVLVAHGNVLAAAANVSLAEGEAAIFWPGGDSYGLVARVLPDEWAALATAAAGTPAMQEYAVPAGSRPHDVAPAGDGTVWYTAQASGELGRLDPATGDTRHVKLGEGSAPHGVIVGPDGAAWVTDSGQNAIVRVDPVTEQVQVFPLPEGSGYANMNTATFDGHGVLWFTGQSGVYGRLDPAVGRVQVFAAPRGRGPYGIATTPQGDVYYASLAGSHIARIDLDTGAATVLSPPTPGQGARRVWSDSRGRIWVSEWNGGQVAVYDPAADSWREWRLPGERPQPYAVYVDDQDMVWLSDFGANALVRFDPQREEFEVFSLPGSPANVRQILGRPGEVWGAESGTDRLVVIRTR